MKGNVLKGHLDLLLLAAVSSGHAHGYAIIEHLRSSSGDTFALLEGTIYPALHRLEKTGLLTSRWSEVQGRRRRTYELTPRGQEALARQREDWRTFARAMDGVLESSPA